MWMFITVHPNKHRAFHLWFISRAFFFLCRKRFSGHPAAMIIVLGTIQRISKDLGKHGRLENRPVSDRWFCPKKPGSLFKFTCYAWSILDVYPFSNLVSVNCYLLIHIQVMSPCWWPVPFCSPCSLIGQLSWPSALTSESSKWDCQNIDLLCNKLWHSDLMVSEGSSWLMKPMSVVLLLDTGKEPTWTRQKIGI